MAGAEDVKQRHGQDRLDEDFQSTSADEAGIVLGILVEVEGEGARLFLGDDFARRLPDFGFDAAAADGAGDGAVVAHEHFGAWKRGDGAARVHDGGHGALAALALQLHDLLVDVHHPRLLDLARGKSNRGVFAAEFADLGDELGHADAGGVAMRATLILDGHGAFVAGIGIELPDAIHVDRGSVVELVADVRDGGVGNAGGDLGVGVLCGRWDEVCNVEIDSGVGRVDAMHDFKADIGGLRDAGVIFEAEHDAF